MDKREVIYYSDELNDEFSIAQIDPINIDENYVYIHDSLFKKFTHFFWYRVVATPIAFFYCKGVFALAGSQQQYAHQRRTYMMIYALHNYYFFNV